MPDHDLTASDISGTATGTDWDGDDEARYVPVVEMLLDRTTPLDLPSIDIGLLARLDRERKRRRRALASVAAVAAVAGLTSGTVALTSGADEPPEVGIAPAGPDGQPLTEPVGAWHQAADPPFEPRSDAFSGTLGDGRMVVWGGHDGVGDQSFRAAEDVEPTGVTDGGIYDPETDTWEAIPPGPALPTTPVPRVHLVDDRMAVVTLGADDNATVAVYDVAEGRWLEVPTQDTIPLADAMAWDGETFVLVRAQDREVDLDEPLTLRWQVGEDEWTEGAPFPHGFRYMMGSASDVSRIAVWGGTPAEKIDMDEPREAYGDGAIYNIAEDTWQLIPEGPLTPGFNAAMSWNNGRLLVGSRYGEEPGDEELSDLAAYDPLSETWEELPAPPEGSPGVARGGSSLVPFVEGENPIVADLVPVRGPTGVEEIKPRWFLSGGAWKLAPLPGLRHIGDFVVADPEAGFLGRSSDSIPYELKVRAGPDEWFDAAEAPFDNHYTMAKTSNDRMMLVIVGGEDEDAPPTEHTAWVFDLTG